MSGWLLSPDFANSSGASVGFDQGLAYFCLGLSLWFLRTPPARLLHRWVGSGLAGLVVAYGVSTLLRAFGRDFASAENIEIFYEAFWHSHFAASLGALNFVAGGLALALIDLPQRSGRSTSQYVAMLVGLSSLATLLGFASRSEMLFSVSAYAQPSLFSTIAFGLLSSGVIFARPDRGFIAPVMSPLIGGYLARRLMITAILVPFSLAVLDFAFSRMGMYRAEQGFAFLVLGIVAVFAYIIWKSVQSLNTIDARRLQTKSELKQSQEYFHSLADSIPQIVWTANAQGELTYVNQRWTDFAGSTAKNWDAAVHLDDRARLHQLWEQARHSESPLELECRFRRALDGVPRWFLMRALPVRDPEGRLLHWFGTCTDIDIQKRDKEVQTFLAQVSEILTPFEDFSTRVTRLAHLAAGPVADWCIVDLMGAGGYLQRAAITGLTEAQEREAEAFFAASLDPAAPGGASCVLRTGESVLRALPPRMTCDEAPDDFFLLGHRDPTLSATLRRWGMNSYISVPLKDAGRIVAVLTFMAGPSGRRYDEGDQRLFERIARKIGFTIERARLNRERNETLKLLDTLLEAAPAGFALLDPEFKVVRLNRSLATVVGHALGDIIGRKLNEVWPRSFTCLEPKLRHVQQTGRPIENFNLAESDSDPQGHHWLVSCYPIQDDDGRLLGLGIVMVDITDRQRAEIELSAAKEDAENANRAKSAFLANVSHEIRTPLGAILGFAEVLLQARTEPERVNYVSIIKRNGEQLVRLIDDILDLSKVEAGKVQLEEIFFNLREHVEEVLDLLSPQIGKREVRLSARFGAGVPERIKSDPLRLRQVLLNVVGNAVKFTQRGSVELSLEALPFSSARDKVRLSFTVKDTGIGIAPDKQRNLFMPFSQADNSMTRQFGGTGLGLVLSRRLARIFGGDLVLKRSELGRGSVFEVTIEAGTEALEQALPAVADPVVGLPVGANFGGGRLRDVRVLVVEDSLDNQVLIEIFLKAEGAIVDTAMDGAEGVLKASESHYDAILMDIQMPLMDGYEATGVLRARGYKLPIIALTAHALTEDRTRALAAGCDAYITKPIDRNFMVQELLNELRKVERAPTEPRELSSASV